jgi:hypothetical protein
MCEAGTCSGSGGRRTAVRPDAITEPGWYRVGPRGLERVPDDEVPEDVTELVRVEVDPLAAVEEPLW